MSCSSGSPAEPSASTSPVTGVSATAPSPTEVLITWTTSPSASGSDAEIERASGTGSFANVATVAAALGSYRDRGLTPTTTYRYRLRLCAGGECSGYTIATVSTPGPLSISTQSLPDGTLGDRYSNALIAIGGTPGYSWSVQSGSLPKGLTLSEGGTLSGTPESLQTAAFTARVRSADGQTATRQLTMRVVERPVTPIVISTAVLPPALVGARFEATLRATGGNAINFEWSVSAGSLPAGVSLSDGGLFSGTPSRAGTYQFTATVSSGGRSAQRAYTLEVVPDDGDRFDVTPLETGAVPPNIRTHLQAAVDRWERVISGDIERVEIPQTFFSVYSCSGYGMLVNGTAVDDVIIIVEIAPIDGEGGILGKAGPCGLRDGGLPFLGALILDSADLTKMIGTNTLTDLFFHEIGHILGFGVLWGTVELLDGVGGEDPRFTGPLARKEMRDLGRNGDVPVEDTGGFGTAFSHWRESVFRSEIMTGYAEPMGRPMPLSRVTIASMGDLGYVVDIGEADTYALPTLVTAPPAAQPEPLGYDVILPGPVEVLPRPGRR